MPRIARAVAAGIPHHVVQRGNRRQKVFFTQEDYTAYLAFMAEWCGGCGVEVWAYCLMPNHMHLIAVPESEDGLRRAVGEAHRRYTRRVNFREGWRGHLWQGRFASYAMDERYVLAAARYIEWNPVRAGMADRPEDYPWSSAAAHMAKKDHVLAKVSPLIELVGDWKEFFAQMPTEEEIQLLRRHERTGRPLGSEEFVLRLEKALGRLLRKQRPGPKKKSQREDHP